METGQTTLSEAEATLDDLSESEKKEKISEDTYHILEMTPRRSLTEVSASEADTRLTKKTAIKKTSNKTKKL
jgi:hypothetical protein